MLWGKWRERFNAHGEKWCERFDALSAKGLQTCHALVHEGLERGGETVGEEGQRKILFSEFQRGKQSKEWGKS